MHGSLQQNTRPRSADFAASLFVATFYGFRILEAYSLTVPDASQHSQHLFFADLCQKNSDFGGSVRGMAWQAFARRV